MWIYLCFKTGGRGNCLLMYSSSLSSSDVSGQPVVKVLSPVDGKHSIVEAARHFCRTVEQKEKTSKDIDVPMFDALLRGEPEAMRVSVAFTLGLIVLLILVWLKVQCNCQ